MTSDANLITIGITCFNASDTILFAIEHAQKQDWPNYEIIIVDDSSSDDSVEKISNYIKGEAGIFLICHKENKGFPEALNTIIQNAKGDYITFFDDDDVSLPTRLSKQHALLSSFIQDKHTTAVMCYTNRDVKYVGRDNIAYSFKAIGRIPPQPYGPIVADYILWHSGKIGYQWGMFGSCTLMVHKALFEDVGLFDPQFRRNTEWDMAIRCAMKDGYFIAVDESLVVQTKTPTADKAGQKPLFYSLLLREKYKQYLSQKNVYLSSRFVAYSRFYGGKNRKMRSHIFTFMSVLVAPHAVLVDKLQKLAYKVTKK